MFLVIPPDLTEIFLKQSAELLFAWGASGTEATLRTFSSLLPSSLLLLPLELGDWLLLWLLSVSLSLPLEWSAVGSWSRYASKKKTIYSPDQIWQWSHDHWLNQSLVKEYLMFTDMTVGSGKCLITYRRMLTNKNIKSMYAASKESHAP